MTGDYFLGPRASFTLPPSRAWSIDPPPPAVVAPEAPPLVIQTPEGETLTGLDSRASAGRNPGNELCELAGVYRADLFPRRGAIVERKHDGLRAIWLGGELVTRSGLPIWSSAHLWPQLAILAGWFDVPMMLDCEYVVDDSFAATLKEWNATRGAGGPAPGRGVLWIFDAVPVSAWQGRHDSGPLIDRKRRLRDAMRAVPQPGLRYVEHWPVGFAAHAERLGEQAIRAGQEGVLVKDPHALHRAGPSRAWLKIKSKLTLDLQVIGHGPMKGDSDALGFILVDYAGRATRVAAGFGHDERRALYRDIPGFAGSIAEIEAMEIMESGALRSPRFIRWRDDLGPGEIGRIRGRADS